MTVNVEKRVLGNNGVAHEFAMLVREALVGDLPDNTKVEIANRYSDASFYGHVERYGSNIQARLYSYGACIRKLDYELGDAVGKYFINDASYSVTTSRHQSAIRCTENLLHSSFDRVLVHDVSDLDDIFVLISGFGEDYIYEYKRVLRHQMRAIKSKAGQKGSRLSTVHKLASEAANIAYNGCNITGAGEVAWLHGLFNNLQQVDNKREIIAAIDGFKALQG